MYSSIEEYTIVQKSTFLLNKPKVAVINWLIEWSCFIVDQKIY